MDERPGTRAGEGEAPFFVCLKIALSKVIVSGVASAKGSAARSDRGSLRLPMTWNTGDRGTSRENH